MSEVVVLGELCADIVIDLQTSPNFGQAETLVRSTRLTLGGSSAITACGLARMGLTTSLVSVVGAGLCSSEAPMAQKSTLATAQPPFHRQWTADRWPTPSELATVWPPDTWPLGCAGTTLPPPRRVGVTNRPMPSPEAVHRDRKLRTPLRFNP